MSTIGFRPSNLGTTTLGTLFSNLDDSLHSVLVCSLCEKVIVLLSPYCNPDVIRDPPYLVNMFVIVKTFCSLCKIEVVDRYSMTNVGMIQNLDSNPLPGWVVQQFGIGLPDSNTIVIISPSSYSAVSRCGQGIAIFDLSEHENETLYVRTNETGMPFGNRMPTLIESVDLPRREAG